MDFSAFVLAASTADLGDEPAARRFATVLEFRMDLAPSPLSQLAEYDGELPVIATNRVEWEGGEAPDDGRRIEELTQAVEHPNVEAIDVELAAMTGGGAVEVSPLLATAAETDVSVIVSAHDFEETPGLDQLADTLAEAADRGEVGKLATTATDRADVLRLLRATHDASEAGHTVATMAMGEPGRHSRAVAPLYGSRIGYAPVDSAAATAPGQYDLETLADLVARLQHGKPPTKG